MRCAVTLDIVHGASHLFEEPGTLEQVATLAGDWFVRHLGTPAAGATPARPDVHHHSAAHHDS
jgi:hypothetical protein